MTAEPIQILDQIDSAIALVKIRAAANLVDLHVTLRRLISAQQSDSRRKAPRILIDLLDAKIEAGHAEVPLFIEFLRTVVAPTLRKAPGTLVMVTAIESPDSALGSVAIAISNMAEFSGVVGLSDSLESAYRRLSRFPDEVPT